MVDRPTVTLVFLVYNRREELRTSLRKMTVESDYEGEVEAIVVDNASTDGASEMVREEFPDVRLIRREDNCGVSAWNDGFAIADGDWVLALDDDCYLPSDGLRRAVEAAREHRADLVSFAIGSSFDETARFDERYRTGLLSFWGCAVLMRREVIAALGGFDPGIFIWAHELEFMLRFYDRGFRHLHLPEVKAIHMKRVRADWTEYMRMPDYRINAEHWAYIAAKLLRPRDALEAVIALAAANIRDGLRQERSAFAALPKTLAGAAAGLRRRQPVQNRELSRVYRHNFHSFASPWWMSRPPAEFVRSAGRALVRSTDGRNNGDRPPGRRERYFAERARYYPERSSTLSF